MSEIPIANLCHMMAYAYGGGFRDVLAFDFGQADASECKEAHSLYAGLLVRELTRQMRRGLCKRDLLFHEVLPSPRGRIDAVRTLTAGECFRARFACSFSEMEEDCLPNQVIKTTLYHLMPLEGVKKSEIRRLISAMEDIGLIELSSVDWLRLSEMHLPVSYRSMLGLCQLIVKGLLQEGRDGRYRVIQMDDNKKASLFEAFVRGFYQEHFKEFEPRKRNIDWHCDEQDAASNLPGMQADIVLESKACTLIIDTKFYKRAWQSDSTALSANFYQIYSYVKNADRTHSGRVRGLLLYARTEGEEELNVSCSIGGNAFFIRMLDLSIPEFKKVEEQLRTYVELLDCDVHSIT